ncbi:MAG: 2-oxo acid dehydrogenase subunit E2 [Myxococcales bacterium]|nr:2-oxo acid dehydrogenase subunit E2 [Myxococcales bacterium]HQY60319.1 dihydrolipoamide acetyltransferase family protein [Polyangiaceae bacterium]
MAKILEMPKLSPTMEEGVLSAWHKKTGDAVAIDDLLAEVETDKATMEFRAFDAGTLLALLVDAGAQVRLGQPVAIVGIAGEDIAGLLATLGAAPRGAAPAAAPLPAPAAPAPAPAPAPVPVASAPAAPATSGGFRPGGSALDRTSQEPEHGDDGETGRVLASPYVRKLARDRGLALDQVRASGKHGRVLPEDLEAAATTALAAAPLALAGPASPASSALAPPEVRPLSPMRRTIARRLVESKSTVPHFYLTIDVDAAPLSALRESVNARLAEAAAGKEGAATKLSVNDLLIKAVALALARVPECNAQFSDEGLLVHSRVDISVAVAVPDGLVTPVVRDADKKSVAAIAAEVRELARRARARKLRPEEMSNGTFSISNLGMFGIDTFSAVINPPEGAILAVGRVRDEPVVVDGAVVPGKRLGMTLSCDHRVIDGAVGAAFLAELRALLEAPMLVLAG